MLRLFPQGAISCTLIQFVQLLSEVHLQIRISDKFALKKFR